MRLQRWSERRRKGTVGGACIGQSSSKKEEREPVLRTVAPSPRRCTSLCRMYEGGLAWPVVGSRPHSCGTAPDLHRASSWCMPGTKIPDISLIYQESSILAGGCQFARSISMGKLRHTGAEPLCRWTCEKKYSSPGTCTSFTGYCVRHHVASYWIRELA